MRFRDVPLVAHIGHQLVEFGAGRRPVVAQAGAEVVARAGCDGEAAGGQCLLDDALQVAPLVGIAGQRCGVVGVLEKAPEARARAQLAGLDDNQSLTHGRV